MTARIVVDCLGQRFDACILNQEPKKLAELEQDEQQSQKQRTEDVRVPLTSPSIEDSIVTKIEVCDHNAQPTNDEPEEASENPVLETVGDLRAFIAEKLEIEPDAAKIIHRGKLIGFNKEERLSTLRFKDKDVIKVMAQQVKTDPGMAALSAYERKNLIKLNETFERNGKDLDLLERNFLDGDNRAEMIKKTEKILRLFNEAAEKHLEAIDSLTIYQDATPEDQKTRVRNKRKQLVDGILNLLHLNDKYLHRLDDYKFRTEHPDEGR